MHRIKRKKEKDGGFFTSLAAEVLVEVLVNGIMFVFRLIGRVFLGIIRSLWH